jgi:UDP-GlcNAc:undecaprenyl-phosphate/decaprenyl-phosphate GlcNAc-1-phosphate transferase
MQSVLFLLGTIGFSYALNKILLRHSRNFGVDSRQAQTNLVRWASTSKPTTGGISFYITFLFGTMILLLLRPELAGRSPYLALFLSASLAFMIGFADDAYGTHPSLKFLGQLSCAGILIFFGLSIEFFVLWSPNLWLLDWVLTVLWVVGIMNSLNMLDNMDGVTTTIATTLIVVTLAMVVSREGLSNMFYILIAIGGGFLGFLFWNWKPAKIYMGDTGSMFIGMVLAYGGIVYFWNSPATPDNISHIRSGLLPLLVFLVPIMDTTFVTIARLSRGRSPFVGGKDHLTHNLVRVGVAEEMVPVTLGIVSVVSGLLGLYLYRLTPEWQGVYAMLFFLYPVVVVSLFATLYYRGTRIGKMKEVQAERERLHLERVAAEETERAIA